MMPMNSCLKDDSDVESRIRTWFEKRFKDKYRLRSGEVCDALGNFGLADRPDDLRDYVAAGLMTPLPKVNGEVKAHYHRECVIAFLVRNCRMP